MVRAQGTTSPGVYNYWSSPVLNNSLLAIMQNGLPTGSALNTYKYNAVNATGSTVEGLRDGWVVQNASNVMQPAVGFITTSAGAVQFNGTPNNGNILVPAIHGTFTDFNLVGNPYPGPLDASAFITANQTSNIIPAIYFWDDDASLGVDYSTNDYIVTNPVGTVGTGGNGGASAFNGLIATGQSFFVEARPTASDVTFSNSMRTTGAATFFPSPIRFCKLWLRVNGDNNLSNEALIAFGEQATDSYDDLYDAKKIAASQNIALYTNADSLNLAIQAMSALTTSKIVPVGFDVTLAGNYAFSIANMEGIQPTVLIYLEDRQEGIFHNLRISNYNVAISTSISGSGRFFLHFSAPIEITTTAETCSTNDGTIEFAGSPNLWSYQVVNNLNQTIAEGVVSENNVIEGLAPSVYILRFTSLDNSYTVFENVEVLAGDAVTVNVLGITQTQVGETANFIATATNATEITWDFGDGTELTVGNEVNHSYHLPGIYNVTATASNSACTAVSQVNIAVTADFTGLNHIISESVNVYPNPANNYFTITLHKAAEAVLEITDLTGKLIRTENISGQLPNLIATSEFASGIYLLHLNSAESTETFKISISH